MEARTQNTGTIPASRYNSSTALIPGQEKNKEFVLFRKVQGAMRYVPDFGETCKAILDAVIDETDAENCSIMLKDPVSGELSALAAHGKNEGKSVYYSGRPSNGKRFKPGEGIAGWVLKEGQALMVDDGKDEPRFVQVNGLNNKVRSLICFPIREKDQVVGVFNLSHSKIGAFDDGNKLALSYISTQVGAALTSARFFLKIHDMNRLMKEQGRIFPVEKPHLNPPASPSTFVEVGEMMASEHGIFIYASEKMHRIKEIIDQVANTDVTILIQGESGGGKEIVARSIHQNSVRRDKPFAKANCAAIPPGLQDREFSRLGGKKDVRVDVRVLVATNRNIEKAVREGRFREDLYYRVNVVNIMIPPLRERKD